MNSLSLTKRVVNVYSARLMAKFLGQLARLVGNLVVSLLLVALFAVIGFMTARSQLADFMAGTANRGEFLMLFTMVCVFTVSYVAYRAFQDPTRIEQLKQDFKMLATESDLNAEDAYRRAQSYGNYIVGILLATAFAGIGLGLFFWPPPTGPGALINVNTLQAMRVGFLGAYVFSLQLIYRRYTTYDLQPAVYLYCAFALAMGLIFNFVAFEALTGLAGSSAAQEVTGLGSGLVAILAFALGYFPNLAIMWFNQVSTRALGSQPRRADALPLQLIDGISAFHEVRLRDNGVDNVQNLAAVDIGYLLVHSAFSAQEVVDWVDQAILYLYLDLNAIESFRRTGIRSMSDFCGLWNNGVVAEDDKKLIATHLQITEWRLTTLSAVILRGPNVQNVMIYWEKVEQKANRATDEQKKRADLKNQQESAASHENAQQLTAGPAVQPVGAGSAEEPEGQSALDTVAGNTKITNDPLIN